MKKVLTIAGSDCSGGAGIQADLKTMAAHRVYGMSVITALTAQNTTGVYGILEIPPEFVEQQLDCIFTDIVPDAVKIGMTANAEILQVIAEKLRRYHAKNIVLDPVMVSTSGNKLLNNNAYETLVSALFPLADLITPNLSEAEVLTGLRIKTEEDMLNAARVLSESFKADLLIKGGHLTDSANDLFYSSGNALWIKGSRIDTKNTHGTGCTLSSAIASNLALGYDCIESVQRAKTYLTSALQAGLDLGQGSGPLNHQAGRIT